MSWNTDGDPHTCQFVEDILGVCIMLTSCLDHGLLHDRLSQRSQHAMLCANKDVTADSHGATVCQGAGRQQSRGDGEQGTLGEPLPVCP